MRQLKINIYQFRSKMNSKSESPIYLRIIYNCRYIQLSSGIYLKADYWDAKKSKIKSKHQDCVRLNRSIDELRQKVFSIFDELNRQNKVSLETIKMLMSNKQESMNSLINIIDFHNQRIREKLNKGYAHSTYRHYISLKNIIRSFLKDVYKKEDILLSDLNNAFITKFEHFLATKKKNHINTVAKKIVRLRTIINLGIKNDWITKDPFKNFSIETIPANRQYLTEDEIKAIKDVELSDSEYLTRVRDMFIFICYTGLSYSDLQKLNSNDIINDIGGQRIICISRTKTFSACRIPLLPLASHIIEKYINHPLAQNRGSLLPIISNQKMNEYLKIIARKAGITKKLSCHIGRHSFATLSLERGVPIETLSSVLGHRSIKTTQIYGKITNTKTINDYRSFFQEEIKQKEAAL